MVEVTRDDRFGKEFLAAVGIGRDVGPDHLNRDHAID